MSDDRMGNLAAQDNIDDDIDWSSYNQPFGTLTDTNPVVANTVAGPIRQGDVDRGISLGMGFSGGGLGIKAFHSSPHTFDRFDFSKIGTGEGAQVYGHGLYFAENPNVSGRGGQYWENFLNHPGMSTEESIAAQRLREHGFDRQAATEAAARDVRDQLEMMQKAQDLNDRLGYSVDMPYRARMLAARQREHEVLASDRPIIGPTTYEVGIQADPNRMLDWDKTLSQQSPYVQDRLAQLGVAADKDALRAHADLLYQALHGTDPWTGPAQLPKPPPDPAGSNLLSTIGLKAGGYGRDARIAASNAMDELGIPGIKYLDAGSRGAGTGTSNYVTFANTPIDILRRYGIVAAPAGTLGALAAQDRYDEDQ